MKGGREELGWSEPPWERRDRRKELERKKK